MRPVIRIDARRSFVQRLQRECIYPCDRVVMKVQEQNSQQHQYRSGQGVEEELDGGVEFPRPAPYPDQQIHGHQHRFPEHKEEEEIQGHEHAQHARLQKQKPDVVFLHPILDRGPR